MIARQHDRHRVRALLVLVVLLCAARYVAASAADPFDAGLTAFRGNDLETALRYFQEAASRGAPSPQLDYNLGVVHFRLGNLADARAAFERLTELREWRSLAWYNLGLVAEAARNPDLARLHYERVRQFAHDPRLRELAENRLSAGVAASVPAGARATPPARAPTVRPWAGYLAAALGHDDNVALQAGDLEAAGSGESDLFADLLAVGRRTVSGSPGAGWQVEVGAFHRRHLDVSEFDFGTVNAGLVHQRSAGAWQLQTGVRAEQLWAGPDPFATQVALRFAASRRIGEHLRLRLAQGLRRVEAARTYEYLSGWEARGGVDAAWSFDPHLLRGGLHWELNDREDLGIDEAFYSYSPIRFVLFAEWETRPAPRWRTLVRAEYRDSRYGDADRVSDPDGSPLIRTRAEDRLDLRARLSRETSAATAVFAEFQHADNAGNLPGLDYRSRRLLLGIEHGF